MPVADRQEAVAEARREAHRLSRLVADLLALARADAGVSMRREAVELDRVLMQAFSEAHHFSRGQQMDVSDLEPAVVFGDADRLKQLFLILLDNATKYTPTGGSVMVSMQRVPSAHDERGTGANGAEAGPGEHVEVTVTDTGIGIRAEDLPHVFERFYRADPARGRDPGGTGLGLSIARWIVEQHGGEISVESQAGSGTTVKVQLPLSAQVDVAEYAGSSGA
jgi:signal transduction histidine kinase